VSDVTTAREGIDRLLAAYGLLLDSGDIEGCTELFIDDCEFVIADGRPFEGRDELRRFLERVQERGGAGMHLPSPPLVDVAPDGTTATMWQSFFFVANGSNTVVRGMYRDLAERDGNRWRFRRRDIEFYPGPE